MTTYRVEHKIRTLAENAVFEDYDHPEFEVEHLTFRQWEFNHGDEWLGDAWLVAGEVQASTVDEAYAAFHDKLTRIIPRIALISQCFINSSLQSFVIHRPDRDFVLFRYTKQEDPVGLMFMEDNKKALAALLVNETMLTEFYYFWYDAVNATGYTAKILLMSSAVHALTKKANGDSDYDRIAEILNEDLKNDIFAPRTGIRHRLSHGEYLSEPQDAGKNYVELLHKAIVRYFNTAIFGKELITEDVVQPHRNFSGSVSAGSFYVKGGQLDLKSLVDEFDKHPGELGKVPYDFVSSDETGNY